MPIYDEKASASLSSLAAVQEHRARFQPRVELLTSAALQQERVSLQLSHPLSGSLKGAVERAPHPSLLGPTLCILSSSASLE